MYKWYPKEGPVTALTTASFQAFVETHARVFIHFAAAWNGYDRMLVVKVIDQAVALQNKVWFASVDIDAKENFDLCVEHRVTNVPFIAIYTNGKLQESGAGYDYATNQLVRLTQKTH